MIYLIVFAASCGLMQLSEHIRNRNKADFFLFQEKKKSKPICIILTILALLLPAILAGLRDSSIGTDVELYGNYWFEYAGKYKLIPYIKMGLEQSIGLVYMLLNYAVSMITDDVKVFYFVLSLLETVLVYMGVRPFRDKISVPFAMFCYYTIFYNNTLNLLRQSLAVAFVCFSYQYLVRDKIGIYLLISILAVMSHYSAIFVFLLIFIWKYLKRCSNKLAVYSFNLILFTVLAFIMITYKPFLNLLISHNILSERFLTYMKETVVGGRLIRIGFWFFVAFFAYIAFGRMINYDKLNKFWISCVTLSMAFSLIVFMGNVYAIRMAYYFDGAVIIFLPMIPKVYKLRINNMGNLKYTMYLILAVVLIARWYLEYVHSLNGETYPYKFADF